MRGTGFSHEGHSRLSLALTDQGRENGIRFLLVSGQRLQEPVAWYGPIVINTQAELRNAFDELERGTFLKYDQQA